MLEVFEMSEIYEIPKRSVDHVNRAIQARCIAMLLDPQLWLLRVTFSISELPRENLQ